MIQVDGSVLIERGARATFWDTFYAHLRQGPVSHLGAFDEAPVARVVVWTEDDLRALDDDGIRTFMDRVRLVAVNVASVCSTKLVSPFEVVNGRDEPPTRGLLLHLRRVTPRRYTVSEQRRLRAGRLALHRQRIYTTLCDRVGADHPIARDAEHAFMQARRRVLAELNR